MFNLRTLSEGKWPILILAILTVLGILWCIPAAVVAGLLLVFTFSFFRDPNRRGPTIPSAILAPADGRIVEVKPVREPDYLRGEATMVAIFLSVFDVHVQRAPLTGTIKFVKYTAGKFHDVRHPDASTANENRVIGFETADGFRVTVKQIAGLIARRIVGWKGEGDQLERGERLGMIRFGSRVEIFLPPDVEVLVKPGDYAWGGETIVARRK